MPLEELKTAKGTLLMFCGLLVLSPPIGQASPPEPPFDAPPALSFKPVPPFTPHVTSFVCKHEAEEAPPLDPEADRWYTQGIELENNSSLDDERAGAEMVRLMRKAVERKHWKAMIALAHMYHQGRDRTLPDGRPAAARLMEQAMRMGVPAAYYNVGTWLGEGFSLRAPASQNVHGDPVVESKHLSYGFLQKAAAMGSPAAMEALGTMMRFHYDEWSDASAEERVIGQKMLQCAFEQGYGAAAFQLSGTFDETVPSERDQAIKVLHEGVKLGCVDCAGKLGVEYGEEDIGGAKTLQRKTDLTRANAYNKLHSALAFHPDWRFPNLDKVLPLPPSKLAPIASTSEGLIKTALDQESLRHYVPAP
jgi:hypothetical protein